jgi:hypothetical protein
MVGTFLISIPLLILSLLWGLFFSEGIFKVLRLDRRDTSESQIDVTDVNKAFIKGIVVGVVTLLTFYILFYLDNPLHIY